MSETGGKLFDHLAFAAQLPVELTPVEREPDDLERQAADERNQQLLGGLSMLDRSGLPLAEESPDMARELSRMENKLDLMLLMLSTRLLQLQALPPTRALLVSAAGLALQDDDSFSGPAGLYRVRLYANPTLALAFDWWARYESSAAPVRGFRFVEASEGLQDALVRWVFRHHRRQLAGRGGVE